MRSKKCEHWNGVKHVLNSNGKAADFSSFHTRAWQESIEGLLRNCAEELMNI